MEKLTLFHLTDCPYCHYAQKALAELGAENPAYRAIPIEWIEERRQPDLAAQYDYYYVPSLFAGKRKLYEANPAERYEDVRQNLRAALDTILGANSL